MELVVDVQRTYEAASFGNGDPAILAAVITHYFWLDHDVFNWDH
jgi:hypothetical protein